MPHPWFIVGSFWCGIGLLHQSGLCLGENGNVAPCISIDTPYYCFFFFLIYCYKLELKWQKLGFLPSDLTSYL